MFSQNIFLLTSKCFTSSWEVEAVPALWHYDCCYFVVEQVDKRTWRTVKSSMVMSLPWLLFMFGGKRITTPSPSCTSLFKRELFPGSEIAGGKGLLQLLGAMKMYNKEPVTPLSRKSGPVPLQGIFCYKGKSIFPLYASVIYVEVI